jgi:hypothetical protein
VQAFLMAAAAGLVYFITCEVLPLPESASVATRKFKWGRPIPLAAALLTAFCPFTAAFSGTLLTETVALFWLILSVWFWLKVLHYPRVPFYWLLLGVSLAWLMETRPTFIYLPVLPFLTAILFAPSRWKLVGPLLTGGALLLFFIPTGAANYQYAGSVNPVYVSDLALYNQVEGIFWETNGSLRYQRLPSAVPLDAKTNDDLRHFSDILPLVDTKAAEVGQQTAYWHTYFNTYVSTHLFEFIGTAAKRLWYQWDQHYLYAFYDPSYFDYRWLTDNLNRFYLIMGLIGLASLSSALLWRGAVGGWPLVGSLAYLTLVNAVVRTEFRYTLPAYPLLMVLVAVGISRLGRELAVVRARLFKESASSSSLPTLTPKKIRTKVWLTFSLAVVLILGLSLALPLIPPTTAAHEQALDALDQASDYQKRASLNLGAAHADYNKAVALDPSEPQVYLQRGQFLANQKQASLCDKLQARSDLERYLQLALPSAEPRVGVEQLLQTLPATSSSVTGC